MEVSSKFLSKWTTESVSLALYSCISKMKLIECEYDSDLDSMPADVRMIYDALGYQVASLRDLLSTVMVEYFTTQD